MWYRLIQTLLQGLFLVLFRVRVMWRGNVPAQGGVLLISNHQSFLDPILVGLALPRLVSYMARQSLFRRWLPAKLLASVGTFPVRRGRGDIGAIREAITRLEQGSPLLVFPEGTRTYDGALAAFRDGFAMIARRAGVPIVPVAIEGEYVAWPRGRKMFRCRTIRVGFGRPITPAEAKAIGRREVAGEVRTQIERMIERLASIQHD